MEREIVFTDIRGTYIKDYDTFGKMDPFLQFFVAKQSVKTEVASRAGKQPKWKDTITFKFYDDQQFIIIKGWENDSISSNDYTGQCKIDIKSLKDSGEQEVKMLEDDGTQSATIFFKYTLKNLPPVPILTIKKAKCSFYKDTQFVLKTKPFFSISSNGGSIATGIKEKADSRQLSWEESIKIKIKQGQKIVLSVQDSKEKDNKIFVYDAYPKEFNLTSGSKSFNVIDRNFQPLGALELQYETQNYVTKQQSIKNDEKVKKQSGQLLQISIQSIKGNLNKEANDLYFKIISGPNLTKTQVLSKAPKDFSLDVKKIIYLENKQNKIVFAAYNEQSIGGDSFYGSGEILLDTLASGKNTVKLVNRKGAHFGDIIVNASTKKVAKKQLTLTYVKVKLGVSGDIVGDSDIYVVGRIGGWSSRTQALQGKQVVFSKNLNLKFSQQKVIQFEVMDEDISKDDSLYKVSANIEQLKELGQLSIPLIQQKYKNDKSKHGVLSFKYQSKNVVQAKKAQPIPEPKKQDPPVKEEPKKQEPPKEQPKKQEPAVKEEPKKQEPAVKEQPKKQEPPKKEQKDADKKVTINEKKLDNSIVHSDKNIDKSNLEKSRNSTKLPTIKDAKNYGDRIFDKQSSSTLQKSIVAYSVPKANRFVNFPKYSGQPTFVMDSCFKTNTGKGAGFGFGSKKQFPDWMQRNMKENPAPGAYFDHPRTAEQYRAKGPTFGLPHKYYEKVMIPRQKPLIEGRERRSPDKIVYKHK